MKQSKFGRLTYESSGESKVRKQFLEHFNQCPIPEDEILANLGMFLNSKTLSRVLFLNYLYQQIVDIPGIVIEFGVRWGHSMVLFAALRGIYDTFNRHRKIVGFDSFTGFPSISKKDGKSMLMKKGTLSVSPG